MTWIGYDTPRKLGDRETGGGLSLPVWISYMQQALQGVPVQEPAQPEGVTHDSGDWSFTEYSKGGGVSSLGLDAKSASPEQLPAGDEKKRILDLFKN